MSEDALAKDRPGRRRNPYPGLRPFRSDEEHLFFGRENQVDSMIDRLAERRFLAVVGTSGSGKSSLVNCGLRPALHRGLMARAGTAWRVAQFRPGASAIRALAQALATPGSLLAHIDSPTMPIADIAEATLRMSNLGLVDLFEQAQLAPGVNLLVVVDQFEELFRYRQLGDGGAGSGDAAAFVNLLLEARGHPQCAIHVVLTMRSDFLGECAQFAGLPEAINGGQYLVPRMTREETRRAIVGPVQVAGAEISPLLVTRLLNDVGDNPDQLSILQHALNRTWARWQNDGAEKGPLDLAHYEAIGTMAGALDQHAEKAFAELPDERLRCLCERVFKALTDRGTDARGVRRPTRLALLRDITAGSDADLQAVLAVFRKPSRSFLMPPDSEPLRDDTVIDVSHESLMRVWSRLRRWSDEEAGSARIYRRLADTAALHALGEASLWRDPDLRMALDWRHRDAPTPAWGRQYHAGYDAAMQFLRDSHASAAEAQAREEVERRWDKYGNPAIIVIVMAAFVILQDRWLVDVGGAFARRSAQATGAQPLGYAVRMLANLLIATPFLLLFWGLSYYGRGLWRRMALPRLAQAGAREHDDAEARPRGRPLPQGEAVAVLKTRYGSTGRRMAAFSVDLLLQLLVFVVIGSLLTVAASRTLRPDGMDDETYRTALGYGLMLLWTLGNWLYNALSLASRRQGTPGMRLLGLQVAGLHGQPVSFRQASGWHAAKLLSYYTAFVGFAIQPFTQRRQTLHDRLAGVVVLRRPAR